jgi:predicted nucleic acid-binding protein
MTAPFVDTNVAAYALDAADPQKQAVARAVMTSKPRPRTSPQVLRELYSVAVWKLGIGPGPAADAVRTLLPTVAIVEDAALVAAALDAADRWQISIWDALIVEGARRAGCARLLSEDLQHGMDFDGVVVEDPFAG